MDPWGFRAEERQGHNRFLASPTINLNKPPGRTFDQEDEEYLQSYPTILHIDSTDSRDQTEYDKKVLLSTSIHKLHHGFVATKHLPRNMSREGYRSSLKPISRNETSEFPVISPLLSPLMSFEDIPGLRVRRSPSSPLHSELASPIERKSNDSINDVFPTIKFEASAPQSAPSPKTETSEEKGNSSRKSRSISEVPTRRINRKSSGSISSVGSSKRNTLLKRKDKPILTSLHCAQRSLHSESVRSQPRIYGSGYTSKCFDSNSRASNCDDSVSSSGSTLTINSGGGWSRRKFHHPDIDWDPRYQNSPYAVPSSIHVDSADSISRQSISEDELSDSGDRCDFKSSSSTRSEEYSFVDVKTILTEKKLYCT